MIYIKLIFISINKNIYLRVFVNEIFISNHFDGRIFFKMTLRKMFRLVCQ